MDFLTQKKFSFASSALPAGTFAVVQFTGEEGLSRLYDFRILLISDNLALDPLAVLNQPASFTIHRDQGDDVVYHGLVCDFEQLHEFDGIGFYRARLAPRLWWLSITHHNQVFLDREVPAFLEEVLKDGGLTTLDYEFRLKGQYEPEAFVCQYAESHFDFLSRWLEREGLYFFFDQGSEREKAVFTDVGLAHQPLHQGAQAGKVAYAPPSGLNALNLDESVQTFSCRSRIIPASVLLKDYNYEKPSLDLESQAEVDAQGRGQVYLYGEHFRTLAQGARLAAVRREELLCRRQEYHGTGSVPYLLPGFLFQMSRHFRPDFNRTYLTVETRHEGSQAGYLVAGLQKILSGIESEVFYRNEFTAIPADVQFRPERRTGKPRVSGTLSAKVDAAGSGDYAELDAQGRYKITLPFDLSGRKDAKASAFLRMAQPYAGADHGMHFPLHKGTEVLLTFIDGDPDRPVIAAAVPNPETPSLVTGANQTQSGIRTSGGNRILAEDRDGEEHVTIHSPFHNSGIQVGSHKPGGGGSIISWTQGNSSKIVGGSDLTVTGHDSVAWQVGTSTTIRNNRTNNYHAGSSCNFVFNLWHLHRYSRVVGLDAEAEPGVESSLKTFGKALLAYGGMAATLAKGIKEAAAPSEDPSFVPAISGKIVNWCDQDTMNLGVGRDTYLKAESSTQALKKLFLGGGMGYADRMKCGAAVVTTLVPILLELVQGIVKVSEGLGAVASPDPDGGPGDAGPASPDLDRYERSHEVLDAVFDVATELIMRFTEEPEFAGIIELDRKGILLKANQTLGQQSQPKIHAEVRNTFETNHTELDLEFDQARMLTQEDLVGLPPRRSSWAAQAEEIALHSSGPFGSAVDLTLNNKTKAATLSAADHGIQTSLTLQYDEATLAAAGAGKSSVALKAGSMTLGTAPAQGPGTTLAFTPGSAKISAASSSLEVGTAKITIDTPEMSIKTTAGVSIKGPVIQLG